MAGIAQSVRFVGMDDVVEIWSAELADRPFMEQGEFGKALESIMKDSAQGGPGTAAGMTHTDI